jgi:hypothetical protein
VFLRHRVGLVALVSTALAVLVAVVALAPRRPAGSTLALQVEPVPLDAADASRSAVGPLQYMGGLVLRAEDPRFGGLSDLRVSADGDRLFAVSDCGFGFTARLAYDGAGRLAGLADARLEELAGPGGGELHGRDAESLVLGERLEVGFEGKPKRLSYAVEPAFAGPVRSLPVPEEAGLCGSNGGLETAADAGDGRRLLVCEQRRGASATVPAWVGRGGAWQEREYPLVFEGGWAGEPFRPTGATRLPGGDLLVLERRFPPLGARLVRVAGASLEGQGPLAPREIARLEEPLTVDNFEGVDARSDASGRTLVYLLSDDNGCVKAGASRLANAQRTLLLLFAFPG